MRFAEIIPVSGYGAPILYLGDSTTWDNGFLVALILDYEAINPEEDDGILFGYGDGNFQVNIQGNTITRIYVSSTIFSVFMEITPPKKLAFYLRKTGTRITKTLGGSITYHILTLQIYDETGLIFTSTAETQWLDPGTPNFFNTAFPIFYLPKTNALVGKNGPITQEDINTAFNLLDRVNCDIETANSIIETLLPYADKGKLFNSLLKYYTDNEGINFDTDFMEILTSLLQAQGYRVINSPVSDYKDEVEIIGIYPLNPMTVEEIGADVVKTSTLIIEVQANTGERVMEIIQSIRGVVDFLNFSTPAKIIREEIWKPVETGINMGFARLTVDFKTFRRRG
jgi:hypothetical protein